MKVYVQQKAEVMCRNNAGPLNMWREYGLNNGILDQLKKKKKVFQMFLLSQKSANMCLIWFLELHWFL